MEEKDGWIGRDTTGFITGDVAPGGFIDNGVEGIGNGYGEG